MKLLLSCSSKNKLFDSHENYNNNRMEGVGILLKMGGGKIGKKEWLGGGEGVQWFMLNS